VGIDAIRQAIPAGTVFVDIARFAVRDFTYAARQGTPYDPFLPARYAVWIVPPAGAGDVRVIDLGDANRIDGLVDEVRSVLNTHSEANGAIATKGEGAAEKELAAATAPLSQLTIQPILRAATAALGAAPKELVISADGKLWLVPFAALPLEDGLYAIEATAIRLITSGRDLVDPAAAERRSAAVGKPLDADAAFALGLVTSNPDDIDWADEVRIAVEERVAMSPDALTGLEANLRFNGPENMFTRVFGRLTAWQNWIFQRPNAVGEKGALKVYGKGDKAAFDWNRV
jgi:hypothetical protein